VSVAGVTAAGYSGSPNYEHRAQPSQQGGLFADPGRPYNPTGQGATFSPERDDEDIIPTGTGMRTGAGVETGAAPNYAGRDYSASHTTPTAQYNPAEMTQSHAGTANNSALPLSRSFAPSASIERIVVFYKDKTFSEYQPA
jgi:hypothetical protein